MIQEMQYTEIDEKDMSGRKFLLLDQDDYYLVALAGRGAEERNMKITAQDLYNLRSATGELSGTDLHELFVELTGEPSPSGRVEIEIDKNRCHPFIALLWQPLAAHADGIQRYAGYDTSHIPANTPMIEALSKIQWLD